MKAVRMIGVGRPLQMQDIPVPDVARQFEDAIAEVLQKQSLVRLEYGLELKSAWAI